MGRRTTGKNVDQVTKRATIHHSKIKTAHHWQRQKERIRDEQSVPIEPVSFTFELDEAVRGGGSAGSVLEGAHHAGGADQFERS